MTYMWNVSPFGGFFFYFWKIIPFIKAEILFIMWPLNYSSVQRIYCSFDVMRICTCDANR